jgi:hypothetical protein
MHASNLYNDDTFVEEFEACRFPNELFHHEDHLRLAWIYLQKYGRAAAETRMCDSIRRYASSLGATRKYHHTMTIAWVRLLAAVGPSSELLRNRDALLDFYSRDRLLSDEARAAWVEPDLRPLP